MTELFGSATTNEVDHCPECVRQRELYDARIRSAPKPMGNVILQNIMDVFQIEGRGTVVTGHIGAAWPLAQLGDEIVLRTPDGRTIKTAIKDMELFRKGRMTPEPIRSSGVLLADVIPSDQLPRGTQMLKIRHDQTT
jgi:translation elongation factor EF-Tu-like GTPase